jgi:hypothetical protein
MALSNATTKRGKEYESKAKAMKMELDKLKH